MKQRPEAVKRICFYAFVSTPLIVLFGGILLWNGQGYLARGDNIGLWLQAMGIVCFVIALVGIVVTWGFWNLQRWAYYAMRFMTTRGTGITVGEAKLLDLPEVREAFGLEVEPPRRDDSW
jgi:hypothetical protein